MEDAKVRTMFGRFLLALLFFAVSTSWVWAGGMEKKLFTAVEKGDIKEVKEILKKGVDVNAKDQRGRTAVESAVERGHKDIADILTKNGAALQLKSYGGMINLYYMSDSDIWVSKDCLDGLCMALTPPVVRKGEEEKLVNPPWANQPAAFFCELHGGEYIVATHANGNQDGICRFKDNSMIMGWDYYKFFQDAK